MAYSWSRVVRFCRVVRPIFRSERPLWRELNKSFKLTEPASALLCVVVGHRPYANSVVLDDRPGILTLDKSQDTSNSYGRRGGLWSEPNDAEEDYVEENEAENEDLRKRHRAEATDAHADSGGTSFADLGLDPMLIERLESLGYKKPFEIQIKTLHHTLKGCDVIGRAVTGSGKTLAFSIPIVQKLLTSSQVRNRQRHGPKAIVIAPTRELANQTFRSIQELHPSVRCVALYGGDSMIRQERALQRGVDVVCATPGRLNDHIERGNLVVNNIEFLCLDEADELLTPNFRVQLEDVLQSTPKVKQMMMFSATMAPEVRHLAQKYMRDPVYVDLTEGDRPSMVLSVEHLCMQARPNKGMQTVEAVIRQYQPERSIVFLKTKVLCDKVAQFLEMAGLQAQAIHSNLSQSRREKIMHRFRVGILKILCATDVAARGLDIPEVDLVIQAEPPANGVDYYIHRSGRTGRAGRKGRAVLIHTGSRTDRSAIYQIEKLVTLKHIPPPETLSSSSERDFEPAFRTNDSWGDSDSQRQQKRSFNRQREEFSHRPQNNYTKDYQQNRYRSNYRNQDYGQNQDYDQESSRRAQKHSDSRWPDKEGGNELRPRRKRFFGDTDE